jgi:hypothetical protein
MSLNGNFPITYFPKSQIAAFEQLFYGGLVGVPNDPAVGGTSSYHARDLFAPWLRDVADAGTCAQAIIIVNYTGYTLRMSGTPYCDGGTLISQPILPDGLTVNTIPPAYTTDRATYLGMGRFVQDEGSIFYGSGIALTMTASLGTFSQDFGIFVAGSVRGGYGLDVCANMANVDPKTRFDAGAGKQTTPLNTRLEESLIDAEAVYDPTFPDERWRLDRARELNRAVGRSAPIEPPKGLDQTTCEREGGEGGQVMEAPSLKGTSHRP